MTAKEKLKLDNPTMSGDEIHNIIWYHCPDEYGYLEHPEFCTGAMEECFACWDRKISCTKEENSKTSKLGSIELGIEVRQCRDCDKGRNVLYLCNGLACGGTCPNPDCKHTTDVRFAKNFRSAAEIFTNGHCVSSDCDSFWEQEVRDDC